ncbi:hypothetical protein NPIL_297231 [Nephila pilipes]|uniref:Uncharacterized protein n=1 Tax=Nephila pilipes TaxID=299642 RepID=A0A8X6PSS5_NEPPI|nr:hypothetical protein NPIL_297231 [Nephila pilipes]
MRDKVALTSFSEEFIFSSEYSVSICDPKKCPVLLFQEKLFFYTYRHVETQKESSTAGRDKTRHGKTQDFGRQKQETHKKESVEASRGRRGRPLLGGSRGRERRGSMETGETIHKQQTHSSEYLALLAMVKEMKKYKPTTYPETSTKHTNKYFPSPLQVVN